MTLVQITNYTSPNCADRPQVNIHCIENLFTVHDFWATCACPEKTKLPWNFSLYWIYFLHSGFLSNFVLALKTEFPLKIFTVLNIFFTIQDFWATLCLPWKTELPWNFSLHWIYFLHSGVLSNLHALSLKSSGCPEFIALIKYFFLSFRIFEQLALSLQNGVALEFFTVLKYFLSFRIFEQLALALKIRVAPKYFCCMEYTFYIQKFWAICMRLPWKKELPWYFSLYLNMYFLSFRIFEQLAPALKNIVAQKFFAVLNIFLEYTFYILNFEQLALALKNRGFPEYTVLNIYFLLFRSFE